MPSVFLTAHQPSGTGSPPFLNDATGQQCVLFGTSPPATISIFNLSGGFYNINDQYQDAACHQTAAHAQFTIGPTDPIVRTVDGVLTAGFVIQANNINSDRHIRVDWSAPAPTTPCVYGTRKKGTVPESVYVTAELVATILTFVGAPQAASAFLVGFYGTAYLVDQECQHLPPDPPVLDLTTFTASAETIKRLFDHIAWNYFCECVPGAPAPIPNPPPNIVLPPGTPTRPVATCDPANICAALVTIMNDLGVLTTVVNQMYAFVTLMQRNGLPFSYVRGNSRSGLSGSGAAPIDRVVGIQAVVDVKPEGLREFTGAPLYISDLGWISVFTPDGMLDEIRLTRDVQTWFSKLLPTATQVGWGLRDGVEITLTELLPEP